MIIQKNVSTIKPTGFLRHQHKFFLYQSTKSYTTSSWVFQNIWCALDFNTEGILLDCLELLYYTKAPRPVSFCYFCDLGKWLFVQDSSIFFDPALENVYIIAFWPQTPKHNKYKEGEGGIDVVLSMNSNYCFLILYSRIGIIFHFFFGSRYKVGRYLRVLTCFDRNWQA